MFGRLSEAGLRCDAEAPTAAAPAEATPAIKASRGLRSELGIRDTYAWLQRLLFIALLAICAGMGGCTENLSASRDGGGQSSLFQSAADSESSDLRGIEEEWVDCDPAFALASDSARIFSRPLLRARAVFSLGEADEIQAALAVAGASAKAGNDPLRLAQALLLKTEFELGRGETARARRSLSEATAARADARASDPIESEVFDWWVLVRLGDIAFQEGSFAMAQARYESARANIPPTPFYASMPRERLANVIANKIGSTAFMDGRQVEALTSFREGLAVIRKLRVADPARVRWRRDENVTLTRLGDVLLAMDDREGAHDAFSQASRIAEDVAAACPSSKVIARERRITWEKLGDLDWNMGAFDASLEHYKAIRLDLEQSARAYPAPPSDIVSLARARRLESEALAALQRADDALSALREARDGLERSALSSRDATIELLVILDTTGRILIDVDRASAAIAPCEASLAHARAFLLKSPEDDAAQSATIVALGRLGDALFDTGAHGRAVPLYLEAEKLARKRVARVPGDIDMLRDLAVALFNVATVQDDRRQTAARESLVLFRRVQAEGALSKEDQGFVAQMEAWLK
ncbi:MAG: hypothetical protein ACOYM8_15665 [Caulobacterales bacterium]